MINKIIKFISITAFVVLSIGIVVLCYYSTIVPCSTTECCIPTNGWHMDTITMGDTTKVTLHYYDEITIEP